jgi:hypothetical protein
MRWGGTFLLAAALAALFSMALGDGGRAITQAGKLSKKVAIALLTFPVALLDERSPGARGQGALRSTKSAPHERVLPTVRDRISPLGGSPVVNIDIPPGTFAPLPNAQPEEIILPQDLTFGALLSQPFLTFPGTMLGGTPPLPPNAPTPPQGTAPPPLLDTSPPGPSGAASPPPGAPGVPPPPAGGSGTSSPPPPEGSGTSSPPPTTVVIPEPGSSTIVISGLMAIGVLSRRRSKGQPRA